MATPRTGGPARPRAHNLDDALRTSSAQLLGNERLGWQDRAATRVASSTARSSSTWTGQGVSFDIRRNPLSPSKAALVRASAALFEATVAVPRSRPVPRRRGLPVRRARARTRRARGTSPLSRAGRASAHRLFRLLLSESVEVAERVLEGDGAELAQRRFGGPEVALLDRAGEASVCRAPRIHEQMFVGRTDLGSGGETTTGVWKAVRGAVSPLALERAVSLRGGSRLTKKRTARGGRPASRSGRDPRGPLGSHRFYRLRKSAALEVATGRSL